MRKFKYNGVRVKDRGEIRGFADEKLTAEKLQRLKDKGWEEVKKSQNLKPKRNLKVRSNARNT